MPSASDTTPMFDTLLIEGVGLLGGSIALAAKQRRLARRVIGGGRNRERLQQAQQGGIIDAPADEDLTLGPRDLAIVCTPVDRIVTDVIALAERAAGGALITDVGSVKTRICREIAAQPEAARRFVGSHPVAGSEKRGWEHARVDLCEGRVCVLTPVEGTPRDHTAALQAFWTALGMRVLERSPEEHDEILARTSHLPHAVAATLASLVTSRDQDFAGSGFRDTTRIAMGDSAIWTPIFQENAAPLLAALDAFEQNLAALRRAVAAGDAATLSRWLESAAEQRRSVGRSLDG